MGNNGGFTLAETLLTVVILFTIVSSFVPLSYRLKTTLYDQKLDLHASEVALEGVKQYIHRSKSSGVKQIEDVDFYWNVEEGRICVNYLNKNQKERKKCINKNDDHY